MIKVKLLNYQLVKLIYNVFYIMLQASVTFSSD